MQAHAEEIKDFLLIYFLIRKDEKFLDAMI